MAVLREVFREHVAGVDPPQAMRIRADLVPDQHELQVAPPVLVRLV
jgi:hypothetical protein